MKMLNRLSILLVLAAVGCKKEAAPPPPPESVAPPVAETPPPPAEDKGGRGMAHCPSSVEGAKTAINPTADAVEVTVTADADPAVAEIRTRAQHLATVGSKGGGGGGGKHTGEGDYGGAVGNCPVVVADTTLTVAEVDKGAKITLKPAAPDKLEWLKGEVEARNSRLGAKPAQ